MSKKQILLVERFIKCTILIAVIFGFFSIGSAQTLNLGFLFRPGFTAGMESTKKSNFNDTSDFGINKYRIQATIPLKTKLTADFKNLKFSARQTFLTLNASTRTPEFSNSVIESQNIHTFSVGITGLRAALFSGLWVYSANIYVSENENSLTSSPQINGMGYLARIKLNNLKFIYFYGLGAVSNYGNISAIPIGGFTTKISKKTRLTAILPIQATLSRKIFKTAKLSVGSTLSGFNSVYRNGPDENLNYRQLKNHITLDAKLSKNGKISLEAGYGTFRKISFLKDNDEIYHLNPKSAPYVSLTFNYTVGKSLFGLKLDGVD